MSSLVNSVKEKVIGTTSPSGQHTAAVLQSKGTPFEVTHRPTPTPGPHDLLIEVKAIALNPIDYYMRDFGFMLSNFPTVVGSDIAGTVISSVSADAPKLGSRVTAFAPAFFTGGVADYGALQTRVLVPAVNATELPQRMSFSEGSLLPMAVVTAWSGWHSTNIAKDTSYKPADKQGILIWGGASSIGSAAVQVARTQGFSIYTTASEKHHRYLKSLGATQTFDYKDENVVESIMQTAKADGITIQNGFDAIGQVQQCLDILKASKAPGTTAKLATSKPLTPDTPTAEGVEVKFVMAPTDKKEQTDFFHFVMKVWLKEKLARGEFVPSSKIQVVEGGLEGANKGLDELKKGVSGVKLVLEV